MPWGWIFVGWQAGDDRGGGPELHGGRWEVVPNVQSEYEDLKILTKKGLLSPAQARAWREGPAARAQDNEPYDPNRDPDYIPLGFYIRQQGERLPAIVLCYICGRENVVDAPSAPGSLLER